MFWYFTLYATLMENYHKMVSRRITNIVGWLNQLTCLTDHLLVQFQADVERKLSQMILDKKFHGESSLLPAHAFTSAACLRVKDLTTFICGHQALVLCLLLAFRH